MKRKTIGNLRPVALAALGVFLGRGAQADTILDFETAPPAGQGNNNVMQQFFGDNATTSSEGVTVSGDGTPNIGLNWGGVGFSDTRWDYYNDGGSVWSAAQLNASGVGTAHTLTFAPNSPAARVVVKSLNFHPYYLFNAYGERFTYDVRVLAGTNVVAGPIHITFQSDGTKNHPITINHTGALGQTLKLRIDRVPSTLDTNTVPPEVEGDPYDIAVDDIVFAQLPGTPQTVGPQVASVSPADDQTGLFPIYSYQATITNGTTTLVTSSIQLRLDGALVSPPPTITPGGGSTSVSFAAPGFLASGSSHLYTLTYSDNLGSNYTHNVQFTAANYLTLPPEYALPSHAGVVRGFTHRTVSANLEAGPDAADTLPNTVARAEAQLNGTLVNTNTSQPYTNSAAIGPNPDGSFNLDAVLNFSDELNNPGNFPGDVGFPGLVAGANQSFTTESFFHLSLAPNYYRFGVNSDDGFQVTALPPQGIAGSPLVVGVYNDGRGAADTLFDFLVTTTGIYRFRVVYFEGWGDANCEFFSVTNLVTGNKALVNDADPNSVASYRVLKPLITNVARSGGNAVANWTYGAPPYQLQFKTNLTDLVWNNLGAPTSATNATVPMQSNTGFIRVQYTQP